MNNTFATKIETFRIEFEDRSVHDIRGLKIPVQVKIWDGEEVIDYENDVRYYNELFSYSINDNF